MKKFLLLPYTNIPSNRVTIAILPFGATRLSTTTSAVPLEEESDTIDSSLIIQDKDLLRKSHKPQPGLRILDLIDAGKLEPTPAIYSLLLKKCTHLKRLEEGRLVHAHFSNSSFKADAFFQNSIINMYCKCGASHDARKAFDEMPVKDMVSFTIMITGYSQNHRPKEAIDLFPEMLRVGLRPNLFTFASLLKASGAVSGADPGKQIHALSVKCGCDENVYVGSSLLDMYARHWRMDEAGKIFDGLGSKNEVSWNALIAGCARKEDGESAIREFWKMQRSGFVATNFTYSTVLSACASIGAMEQGKWVHVHMIKQGHKLVSYVGNTLLDMYAKSGSIKDARKVFDRLDKRDVVSWNSMLTACAQHGLGKETVQHFEEMLKHGIRPNRITFLCVLTACSHGGLVSKGEHYFSLMKEHKVEPEIEHYVTVVDLLGRAGLLDQAKEFINKMPIQPSAAVWGALLGACRMHKNAELGQFAAEQVFELDPYDSGPHMLLSNIYASAGRLSDAAKVRNEMRTCGVKKEPACSWIEIENSIHMFVANDDSHPQIKEIHTMWDKISGMIKKSGYVPDTSCVLSYMDEQEREAKLQYHSEKLALALALLKMNPRATIRIMKNIRMCGDCHAAIKLVSKVMEREIVVRDTNRFHHFNHGCCSCGDYW